MTEIVVPIIATWMKFIVTPVLGFVAIFCIAWGARKFFWCVQILRGVSPPPNGVVRLEPVRDLLRQHLSDEVMKQCQ